MRKGTKAGRATRLQRVAVVTITVALSMTAALVGASSAGAGGGGKGKSSLGPKDVAKGEPIPVGFISDGRNPNLDTTYQLVAGEAITEFLNTHEGGIGGRPIDLITCEAGQSDAAKASECANELVRAGVVVVVLPESTAVSVIHGVLAEAGIPLFLYSITDTVVTTDPERTFVLFDARSGVSALPISVAKDNKIKKVTAVVIDVPPATELYTTDSGKAPFEKAKVELELIPLPPGQPDFTPQMTEIANGDETVVEIVGNDTFCISALTGLRNAGYTGPISTLFVCVTEATQQAVGEYLEGAYVSTNTPVGDPKDPGFKHLQAIYDAYADAEIEDLTQAQNTYAVYMSMWQVIKDLKGEVTPDTVTAAIKAMPNLKVPGGGGLVYRCNGNAKPETPAVCTKGGLRTRLDAQGAPTLPYKVVGNGPVAG